jgi:peptidyl-prolyl cis-trans isomerase SurA
MTVAAATCYPDGMTLTTRGRLGLRHITGAVLIACAATACGRNSGPSSPDVWAVVDGREISRTDVETAYRRLSEPNAPPPDSVLAVRLQILDELINQEILLGRARAQKVDVTAAEIEEAFEQRRSNMPDGAFQQELDRRQLSVEVMKDALRRELIVQKLLEQELGGKVTPTDQEVRDYYDRNRARFNVAETQYRIAQLVVTPVREPEVRNRLQDNAATPAEAQRKVAMLTERLKAGAAFGELARDYSEDPESAPQGGDLGFIPTSALNQVPPELRALVLKTSPGSVGAISAGGAHTFVFVVAREDAGQRDLNQPAVKDAITNGIREQREQVLRAAYIAAARNELTVVNHLARMVVEAGGRLPTLDVPAPAR